MRVPGQAARAGAIAVRTSSGVIKARVLVGADGVYSRVRKQLLPRSASGAVVGSSLSRRSKAAASSSRKRSNQRLARSGHISVVAGGSDIRLIASSHASAKVYR